MRASPGDAVGPIRLHAAARSSRSRSTSSPRLPEELAAHVRRAEPSRSPGLTRSRRDPRKCRSFVLSAVAAGTVGIRAVIGESAALEVAPSVSRSRSKLLYLIPLVVALGVGGAVVALLVVGGGPPTVTITTTTVSVKSGFYSVDVPLAEITEVRLDPSLPHIQRRTNGYASGRTLRGHFDVQGLGNGQLFAEANRAPFVFVRSSQGFFLVNDMDPARTEEIHRALLDAWSKVRPPE